MSDKLWYNNLVRIHKGDIMEDREVTHKDWLKHYFASLLIYGVILIFLIFCPAYYETISYEKFDYTAFFAIYYVLYLIFAPIIFYIVKPVSVLNSRSLTILGYIKRQFKFGRKTEEFLSDFSPNEKEKLSLMTLFIQVYFGVYCVNTLCNNYIADLGYNLSFIKEFFFDATRVLALNSSIWEAMSQFIIDTGDVWLKLIMMLTLVVLACSYLTESDIFNNRIKSVDTTPLGVLSCLAFYYPVIMLSDAFIKVVDNKMLPVENQYLFVILVIFSLIANIGILIAVIRLGFKSGNLTNRGIVTGFPYNIVRHPDYSMQILFIITTTIPICIMPTLSVMQKILMLFATFAWIYLYYLRAITEERHLIKDDEYKEYVQKVKYRFIPKLF